MDNYYKSTGNHNGMDSQPSRLLNRQENELLFLVIGQRCVSLASAVVQVLFSEPGPGPARWRKHFCGVACFIKDNPNKSFFIRIFDIVAQTVLWEHELYHEINYNQALPFFHTFETDDRQAGLNFANQDEAYHFFTMVHEKVRLLQKRREDNQRKRDGLNNNHGPKIDNNRYNTQISQPVSTAQSVQVPFPADRYQNNGQTNNNHQDDKKKKGKSRRITKQDIGLPTNFVHISHIGWDPDRGFDYDDADPTLQELFKKAGIDMRKTDAATRDFIYGFIEKELGGMNAVKKAVVVHPPASANNVPPPPPRHQPRVPNAATQNAAVRPLPPPRTPPSQPRPPAAQMRAQPPPPPPNQKAQAPLPRGPPPPPAKPVNGFAVAPPPPPPPPPPPSAPSGPVPPPPPMPDHLQASSPSSPEADSRSALMDAIRKGKDLKPVEAVEQAPREGRDKLLNEIVDPEKVSLGKNEAGQPLDGMAAALAKALERRRVVMDNQDETEDDDDSENDDEWD